MSEVVRVYSYALSDLLPGQKIIVHGQEVEFLECDYGNAIYYKNAEGETDIARSVSVQIGKEERSDGRSYCPECGGYYAIHDH